MYEVWTSSSSEVRPSIYRFFTLDVYLEKVLIILTENSMEQGRKISRTRILEIWRVRKQILPSCHRTTICHFKRFGYLYFSKPVKFFSVFVFSSSHKFSLWYCWNLNLLHNSYRHVLHKYANEDVSLGSWFIGLDVHHVDDRRLCCGTPPGKAFFYLKSKFIGVEKYRSLKLGIETAKKTLVGSKTPM